MQVLCKLSNDTPDLHCATCGEGFRLYYTRTSPSERHDSLRLVQQTLRFADHVRQRGHRHAQVRGAADMARPVG